MSLIISRTSSSRLRPTFNVGLDLIRFPAYKGDTLHLDMDCKTMESYLDNIAEQVVDEDKIVTYKSLSRSLGIHVNTSKQLLYTYLTNEKSRNSFPISATYLVAGKVIDGSFNIVIVNEADLKLTQSKFVEVTSEHIYSVQKGKSLKDLKVLCAVDKESPNLKSSNLVIKCSKGVLKLREELQKKSESYEETNKKVIKQALVPENQGIRQEKQSSVPEKIETPITNENTSKCPKKTSPKANSGKAGKKSAGNIANLFAKAAQKNALKTVKPNKSTSNDKANDLEVVYAKEGKEIELRSQRRNLEEIGETKESLKKKKKGSKRKRIQMLSDSEESDSDEEETVDVLDEEPPPLTVDLPEDNEEVKDTTLRNKRKKRKVIDKTVMNEDGYLETRKEVVFETDSENEAEEVTAAPKEQKKPKVDFASEKGKGAQGAGTVRKQSSLLTFFKKS